MTSTPSQQQTAQQILTAIFKPAKQVNPLLPEQLVAYVLTGEWHDELLKISKHNAQLLTQALGRPAMPYPSFEGYDGHGGYGADYRPAWQRAQTQKSKQARCRLYREWTDVFSPEQLLRFGKALAMTYQKTQPIPLPPLLPLWFAYLFLDGLYNSTYGFDNQPFTDLRPHWSVAGLAALLVLDKHDSPNGAAVLHVVFSKAVLDIYHLDKVNQALNLPDLENFIQNHLDYFTNMPKQYMKLDNLVEQLKYLAQHPNLAKQIPNFVVTWAVSSHPDMVLWANAALTKMPTQSFASITEDIILQQTGRQQELAVQIVANHGLDKSILENALLSLSDTTIAPHIKTALSMMASQDILKKTVDVTIPTFTPKPPQRLGDAAKAIISQNVQELLDQAHAAVKTEQAFNTTHPNHMHRTQSHERYQALKAINNYVLDTVIAELNHDIKKCQLNAELFHKLVFFQNRLQQLPEFDFCHYLRAKRRLWQEPFDWVNIFYGMYANVLKQTDLRQIAHDLEKAAIISQAKTKLADVFLDLSTHNGVLSQYPNDLFWPFFAEDMSHLDYALKVVPTKTKNYNTIVQQALLILLKFPWVPAQYVPILLSWAVSDRKTWRTEAQQILARVPMIHEHAEKALLSSQASIRLSAAQWLANLRQKSSLNALLTALSIEKSPAVQDAILTALANTGEDLQTHLIPLWWADAQKGLKSRCPANMRWLNKNTLPSLTWQNGEVLEPDMLYWWLILAAKDSKHNLLWPHYIRLLSPTSQQNLGEFVLSAFITEDLALPSEEEALNQAKKIAPALLKQRLEQGKKAKTPTPTLDSITAELVQTLRNTYTHSALPCQGILSLVVGIDAAKAVQYIQQYRQQAPQRHPQIEAMFTAIAPIDDVLITQLLLSIAWLYPKKPSQDKARALVMEIAARQNWRVDELADRTMLTANLTIDGLLHLDYGERIFTAYMDKQWQLELKNAEGKTLKALPNARKTEDADLVSNAKLQLARSKREIPQVVVEQGARLFAAMCTERTWAIESWQQTIFAHPIVRIMATRLVWLNVDANGTILQSFRPCDDGSLINLNDDAVLLPQNSYIKLAHLILLGQDEANKWQQHNMDYQITPFFQQFSHGLFTPKPGRYIQDRFGYRIDPKVCATLLSRRGYLPGPYKSWFYDSDTYCKPMPEVGFYIVIHTDSQYDDEYRHLFVNDICFYRQDHYGAKAIALEDVPPILLAEAHADYVALAESGTGLHAKYARFGSL